MKTPSQNVFNIVAVGRKMCKQAPAHFLLSFCVGIGIIEGGKIAVYCDDNVVRVNERGSLGTCITGNQQEGDGMDPFLARTMVESLSKGINPLSGRVLPLNDSCSNEKIQDALIEILDHCTIESNEQYLFRIKQEKVQERKQRREENRKKYPRCMEFWSKEEERQLIQMHHRGANIYMIANVLKRTPTAIENRLKKIQERPIYRNKKSR